MNDLPTFGMFNEEAETQVESRFLPHWFQPGVAVFVTFRTADSMPAQVISRWERDLRDWLADSGIVVGPNQKLPDWASLPQSLQFSYRKQRDRLWHWQLDSCHGECVLRRRELAQIVMDSLLHFNGKRYDMASAIIMPNHVHLIAQFRLPTTCRKQCKSWLHWTAREINRKLERCGEFWQSEPFDHLIRNEEQFNYLRRYIAENGIHANLPATDWLHWTAVS
jgi:putative transposase